MTGLSTYVIVQALGKVVIPQLHVELRLRLGARKKDGKAQKVINQEGAPRLPTGPSSGGSSLIEDSS